MCAADETLDDRETAVKARNGTGSRIHEALLAVRAVLAERDLRRAQLSWGAAWTGDWLMLTALSIYAYKQAGVGGVALMSVARVAPAAVAVPITSAFADRYRRERVLVVIAVTRCLAVASGAALMATGAPTALVFAVAVAAGVAFGPYMPTHAALLPSLCRTPGELTSSNVVRGWIDSLSVLLGPLLAAVLVGFGTVAGAMAAAALLSLVSGVVVLRVRTERPLRDTARADDAGFLGELVGGFAELRRNPQARTVVGLGAMQTFVRGALGVLTVVIALQLAHMGEAGVGVLTAALGVGGILGALATGLLTEGRRLAAWFGRGIALWSAPLVVVGLWTTRDCALAMLAVVGLANAIVDATGYTLLPRTVGDGVLARVFGAFEALIYAAMALGAAAVPPLVRLVGTKGALVAIGLLLPLLVATSRRRLRAIDDRISERDQQLGLLRKVSFLCPLPIAALEYLAAGAGTVRVSAGDVVFRQGEPGHRYYVVASGIAEVWRNGVRVGGLGPGDGFGEMALLHDAARAATIRATSALELCVIGRDRFLVTVSRSAAGLQAAARLSANYVAPAVPVGARPGAPA